MNEDNYNYVRELYKKFEGLTGSQEADCLLLLAVVLKEGLEPIQQDMNEINLLWAAMFKEMKREIDDPTHT